MMAEVVVVVVEVLLVVGSKKISYRGPCTHISIAVGRVVLLRPLHKAWVQATGGHGTSGEMLSPFFFFISKVLISEIVTRPSRRTPRKPGS